MARRKQRKKSWARLLVLFLVTPVAVWFVAFLLWFYWNDLTRLFGRQEPRRAAPKPEPAIEQNDRREPLGGQPREKIFEEDRQKLEEILKRRS